MITKKSWPFLTFAVAIFLASTEATYSNQETLTHDEYAEGLPNQITQLHLSNNPSIIPNSDTEPKDAASQRQRALSYMQGTNGCTKSDATATMWFSKAAFNGDAESFYWLGVFHAEGRGNLIKSYAAAKPYFLKAAKEKHADAITWIASCYLEGAARLPENKLYAASLFKYAASKDNEWAQICLRTLYRHRPALQSDKRLEKPSLFKRALRAARFNYIKKTYKRKSCSGSCYKWVKDSD